MPRYLFNGIELPALPISGDYLTIFVTNYEGQDYKKYTLIASSIPFAWVSYRYAISNCTKQQANYYTYEQEWTVYDVETNSYANMYGNPIWANYDITLGDGTTLQASDPIPVNPAPTLDPTALLMGWQVGNRIRQSK